MFSVLRISASIVCGLIMASMVASQSGCSIPKSRKNLITYFQVTNEIVDPGEVIPDSGLVEFNCTSGYNLIGRKTTYCSGSSWAHTIPRCSKFCPKPTAAVSTVVTCEYNNAGVECGDKIRPGTKASIKCSEGYDLPSPSTIDVMNCREDGKWDTPQFSCVENCGYVSDTITPYIYRGVPTNVSEVPWQVAIYENFLEDRFRHICSGSIISSNMVISAAHCFWDEANLKPYKKEYYNIAAGKYFSEYSDKDDITPVQYRNLTKILIHSEFTGRETSYKNDVAILVLAASLRFTTHVMPICIKFADPNNLGVPSDILGRFAGWGATENGTTSQVLRSIRMRTISYQKCGEQFLPMATRYRLTNDKFCLFDEYGSSLCQGDSGGGFVQQKQIPGGNNEAKYHLLGILSNDPAAGLICSAYTVTALTDVSHFETFIKSALKQYTESPTVALLNNGCTVPWDDQNLVAFNAFTKETALLGSTISDGDIVGFKCASGFSLNGSAVNYCSGTSWFDPVPKCRKTCSISSAANNESSKTICQYNDNVVECGDDMRPGTRATIRCHDGFISPEKGRSVNTRLCGHDGEWDQPKIDCIAKCGIISDSGSFFTTNIPWHVAIYFKSEKNWRKYCSGSIISSTVVISAAHCFYNHETYRSPNPEEYITAAGKYYADFDAKESNEVQFRNVSKIRTHPLYSPDNYHQNDIAVLVLSTPFQFSMNIGPICVEFEKDITNAELPGGTKVIYPGWHFNSDSKNDGDKILEIGQLTTMGLAECIRRIGSVIFGADKICIRDKDLKFLCRGDSGAGFAELRNISGVAKPRYYLRGIASSTISQDFSHNCYEIVTATNINFYQNFIPEIEQQL